MPCVEEQRGRHFLPQSGFRQDQGLLRRVRTNKQSRKAHRQRQFSSLSSKTAQASDTTGCPPFLGGVLNRQGTAVRQRYPAIRIGQVRHDPRRNASLVPTSGNDVVLPTRRVNFAEVAVCHQKWSAASDRAVSMRRSIGPRGRKALARPSVPDLLVRELSSFGEASSLVDAPFS